MNKELADMDETAKKRIKNLECEAHRYLWYPDLENGNEVRVGIAEAKLTLVSLLLQGTLQIDGVRAGTSEHKAAQT